MGTVVDHGLTNRDFSGVTHVGIDEISKKKAMFISPMFTNCNPNTLIWSVEGGTKETLKQFFEFLGTEKAAQLQGIFCNMWRPYIDVIQECAPQAVLVFDKFHINRHLMDAIDYVRREEIRDKGK